MRRYSERSIALTLAAALLLLPLHASGSLTVFTEPLLEGVESLVAGPVGTAVLPDARTVAARRLAFRTRELIRRCGERAPSVGTLMPQITLAREAALRHGIPVSLILAVIHRESGFQQEAVSPVGAVGLMQVMPQWEKVLGIQGSLKDPEVSIKYGLQVLGFYEEMYKEPQMVLTAYNRGPGPVDLALMHGINPNNGYAPRVLATYEKLKKLNVQTAGK